MCLPRLLPKPVISTTVLERVIQPSQPQGRQGRTALSCLDQVNVITATARAWGFQGGRLDVAALEAGLQATVDDLPFLAGRISKMEGGTLGSLAIEHTGEGAALSVQERRDVGVAAMAPDTWAKAGITLASPAIPFYIPAMNGQRILAGKDPLLRVQLTRLADGDILALSLSHVVVDGMRWPALAAHVAARYRQAACPGSPLDAAALLQPCDRRLMSSQHMAAQLGLRGPGGEHSGITGDPDGDGPDGGDAGGSAEAAPLQVSASLGGYWRLAKLLVVDACQQMELLLLHIPGAQVAALKQLAAAGNPIPGVTTGDAVQSACALLLHAAQGRPLLPVRPHCMAALVQQPTPEGYVGNAAYMLRVGLPPGSEQPAAGDGRGALQALAGALRAATAAFRASPEAAVRELADAEALVAAPALRMLSFLAGRRLPYLTCTTNYVPTGQGLDLGLGPPTYQLGLTMPRARDMAVIRPACHPHAPDGLFAQFCLPAAEAARLRALPLLAQLLPQARFVGGE